MLEVRLYTLTGKFAELRRVPATDTDDAMRIVIDHATSGGYSKVKRVDDGDGAWRYTARTPGGRGGRNVADVDLF